MCRRTLQPLQAEQSPTCSRYNVGKSIPTKRAALTPTCEGEVNEKIQGVPLTPLRGRAKYINLKLRRCNNIESRYHCNQLNKEYTNTSSSSEASDNGEFRGNAKREDEEELFIGGELADADTTTISHSNNNETTTINHSAYKSLRSLRHRRAARRRPSERVRLRSNAIVSALDARIRGRSLLHFDPTTRAAGAWLTLQHSTRSSSNSISSSESDQPFEPENLTAGA